jgi:hypothetical protein
MPEKREKTVACNWFEGKYERKMMLEAWRALTRSPRRRKRQHLEC